MGVSTNATLAFGIDLGEELPEAWQVEYFDFEDVIAERAGISFPDDGDFSSPEFDAYCDAKRAAVKAFPVDLIQHCSNGSPMYFLAVRGTENRARRGYPEPVDPAALVVAPERIEALRAFAESAGIEWKEPAWMLFSYWG